MIDIKLFVSFLSDFKIVFAVEFRIDAYASRSLRREEIAAHHWHVAGARR